MFSNLIIQSAAKNLRGLVVATLWLTVSHLHAADVNVVIPGGSGTFTKDVTFNIDDLGAHKTLSLTPANCYHFLTHPSLNYDPAVIMVQETSYNECGGQYEIWLVGNHKEGTAHVTGAIEPSKTACCIASSGGSGPLPTARDFDITVLQRLAWIYFTDPVNGINLTTCNGSMDNLAVKVVLGNATAPSAGTVTFNVTPSNLGTISPAHVPLSGGMAVSHFYAANTDGSGTITANATSMRDNYGNAVPNVSTNISLDVAILSIVDCWNPCSWHAQEDILFADGNRSTIAVAKVTKPDETPIPNFSLNFGILSGGGTVTPITGMTDVNGEAQTTVKSGMATGTTWINVWHGSAESADVKAKVFMYKNQIGTGSPSKYFDFNTIISDSQFTTTPAAFDTAAKIETWLQGKSSGLAGYVYGGKLISQIIHDSAVANGINAQIILVTLQKEKGLISDPSPSEVKKNLAMGCGLPSNIKSQIQCGAQALKDNFNGAPSVPYIWHRDAHPGDTSIAYIDASNIKNSVSMKIGNKATCSLYHYTPWINDHPNSGANLLFYQLWVQYGF